jgi:hypothetical protein
VLMFFVFVAVVGACILALGYVLSWSEYRPIGRRCRMPYVVHRRRRVLRQRLRCRLEG